MLDAKYVQLQVLQEFALNVTFLIISTVKTVTMNVVVLSGRIVEIKQIQSVHLVMMHALNVFLRHKMNVRSVQGVII
jgi:hypothetical protein